MHLESGGGAGPGTFGRRPAAIFYAGLVMALAGLPAAAAAENGPTPGSPAGETSPAAAPSAPSAPAPEAPGSGKVFPQLHPDSTIQWVGVLGFLLLLLRGACRR